MRIPVLAALAALAFAGCQSTDDSAVASTSSAEKSGADASSRAPAPSAASPATMAPDVEAGLETPMAPQEPTPPNQSPENPR